MPCTIVVGIQAMRGVKLLAVIFVVLLVWVMSGAVLCTVRSANYRINAITKEIVFTQKKKPAALFDGVTGFFVFLCSCGAEIIENHQNNLWSLSAQKYFRLEEPEIIKKIFRDLCP